MALPLYGLPENIAREPSKDGHHGLWYDKFCHLWSSGWNLKTAKDGQSPKLAWIEQVATDTIGSHKALSDFAGRLFDLVTQRGGTAMVATTRSRFVTGLGRSHPVENGFAWHPTLGTPYLPGSSLKGLTRSWALSEHPRDEVDRILGKAGRAGTVAFLDAVPVHPVKLEADVLTPHYANWSENDLPGDWRSPTPVPFLVASPGLSMLFGIVPLTKSAGEHIAVTREWLTSALNEFGAGAKTALGYGQFRVQLDHPFLEKLKEQRWKREAMATPEGRWRLQLEGRTEDELLTAVRENLIKTPLTDIEDRRAFVRFVLETGMVTSWREGRPFDPSRTNTGPRKLKGYARAVRAAAEELGVELPW